MVDLEQWWIILRGMICTYVSGIVKDYRNTMNSTTSPTASESAGLNPSGGPPTSGPPDQPLHSNLA